MRRAVATKIAADQAVHTTAELRAVLEQEAANVSVLGHHESGGLWRLRQMAYLAEAHGIPVNRHACIESAVSTFAALQAMAAVPNLASGNQSMHQLLAESLVVEPPGASVPDGPGPGPGRGLGFGLDEDAIQRAHTRYANRGPYRSVERDHAGGLEWRR